ncbi:unnamed protein product [Auanema sp. JU1783]|nr:unnamed protein product [Auanema sp. JU1783]
MDGNDEANEPANNSVDGNGSTDGPGKAFEIFKKNEELLDKLKLLNYENGFLSANFRPIQRHYFTSSTNVGEQFYLFTSLAGWLIRKAGNESFEMPQEFDDPNSTISNILAELRSKVSST